MHVPRRLHPSEIPPRARSLVAFAGLWIAVFLALVGTTMIALATGAPVTPSYVVYSPQMLAAVAGFFAMLASVWTPVVIFPTRARSGPTYLSLIHI